MGVERSQSVQRFHSPERSRSGTKQQTRNERNSTEPRASTRNNDQGYSRRERSWSRSWGDPWPPGNKSGQHGYNEPSRGRRRSRSWGESDYDRGCHSDRAYNLDREYRRRDDGRAGRGGHRDEQHVYNEPSHGRRRSRSWGESDYDRGCHSDRAYNLDREYRRR